MKLLNFGNLAIVFTLIISAPLSQFYSVFLSTAFVLGLFVMPVYQSLTGFIWFMRSTDNKKIKVYFKGVLSYFFVIFCINTFLKWDNIKSLEPILSFFFSGVPIGLALYFTYILNQNSRKWTF